MGNLGTPQIIIILAVVVLLFGSRKLPELARGLGSSLRIFRSETKNMLDDDKASGGDAPAAPVQEPRAVEAPQAAPAEPVHNPVSEGVTDQIKRDN
jgi:sec-independent protein translocase protein TatA